MELYESILLVKPEVFVYKIPPRTTNRGVRAADWNLQTPDWTGRLRLVAKGKECFLKLEDKNSGELFAKCPIDKYPGIAVEAVMDSSRYFVIRIQDDGSRAAFIGIGFADRGDSFDFNVALQDHFKWLQKTEEIEQEQKEDTVKPQLDLSFKEGQTITINMKIGHKTMGKERARPKGAGATGILLPPPPSSGTGSVRLAPPPGGQRVSPSSSATSLAASDDAFPVEGSSSSSQVSPVVEQQPLPQAQLGTSNLDLLLDLGLP